MTRITMMSTGSRGDVQPYVALGRGLREAGHQVRLVSSEDFAGLAHDAGLEFGSTGMGIEKRLQSDEWRSVTEGGNFLKILQKMQAEMKMVSAGVAERLPALIEGSELIVSGMGGVVGTHALAEARGIPVLYAYVVPMSPTSDFASPLVPSLPLGKVLNRASFHVTRQMFWQSGRVGDVTARKVLGLPKGSFWGHQAEIDRSGLPTLFGYSRHVLPRPHDWDARKHVTGFWFLKEPDGWQPPADLVEFLESGPPPVYIGFGSMGSRNPEEAGRIALEALARAGQRGVLASGWGGLKTQSVPDSVHLVSSMPHSWLFARMAAVVHHGGAGTTAAGLCAGIPSILVPFMGDQPFWGKRVADLGVGPQPIPRKQLRVERLAAAIGQAMTNQAMRDRAGALGEQIRAEDGVGNAVAVIEDVLGRTFVRNIDLVAAQS